MDNVNLTLNHDELLEPFAGDREQMLKTLVQRLFNGALQTESELQLQERANQRFTVDSRT
ncbi:MAG: hypothetical protein PUJ57_00910 [Peptoniphilaceae bacterium]|nr:hypothetical protein [Peptoniphilaceae bacterium]